MLRLEGLRLERGDFALTAGLDLAPGARVAVMGPSGAGKSTLLAAVGGFLAPAAGRILWHGRDITALPPARRPVSTIFQDHNLFPHMTVLENAALGLTPGRVSAAQRGKVEAALARVGLEGYGARRPADLSGGQQSRVALARVLLQSNPILCLDEPFAALGPALKAQMIALVVEVAEALGALVLMITHDPQEALALEGATLVVAEGRMHGPAPTEALLADPPEALRAYLGGAVTRAPRG